MTETAIQKYQPTAPVGTAQNLRALLERSEESIKALLPQHVTPERLTKLLLVAANRNPKILECTQASVIETVMRAAELGLDFGMLGGAHAVPYGKSLTLIPDYRGLLKLVRQSGELSYVGADVVYKNDHFLFAKGSSPKVEHTPKFDGERGPKLGAYAVLVMKDGSLYTDFMSVKDIEAIRARSRAGQGGPWVTDWDEMAKKTVLRKVCKLAPMSSDRLERALEIDNEAYEPQTITVSRPASQPASISSAMDSLADMMPAAPQETPPQQPTPAPTATKPPAPIPTTTPTPAAAPGPAEDDQEGIPWGLEPTPVPDGLMVETEDEAPFFADVPALLAAAKKLIGRHGPALVSAYAKSEMGVLKLENLTEEQYLRIDGFIASTAEAGRG